VYRFRKQSWWLAFLINVLIYKLQWGDEEFELQWGRGVWSRVVWGYWVKRENGDNMQGSSGVLGRRV